MTFLTNITAIDVINTLAGRNHAIVTGVTTSIDLAVVNRINWNPGSSVMASIAYARSINMSNGFTSSYIPIMARHAIVANLTVINSS
jgi:hypothetical protein